MIFYRYVVLVDSLSIKSSIDLRHLSYFVPVLTSSQVVLCFLNGFSFGMNGGCTSAIVIHSFYCSKAICTTCNQDESRLNDSQQPAMTSRRRFSLPSSSFCVTIEMIWLTKTIQRDRRAIGRPDWLRLSTGGANSEFPYFFPYESHDLIRNFYTAGRSLDW